MSLMNDALRKKSRETAGEPAARGFSGMPARPPAIRKGGIVLAATILLAGMALGTVYLTQAAPGGCLLKTGSGRRPSPPDHAVTALPPARPAPPESRSDAHPPASALSGTSADAPDNAGDRLDVVSIALKPAGRPASDRTAASKPVRIPAPETATVNPHLSSGSFSGRSPGVSRSVEPDPAPDIQGKDSPSTGFSAPREPDTALKPQARHGADKAVSEHKATLFLKKALDCHRNGRLTDAAGFYRQVLATDANHPQAMLNLAAVCLEQGNHDQALSLLHRLERLSPRPAGVWLNLAIAAMGMEKPEQSLVYLDQAEASADAPSWEIHFHRAAALARLNRLPEALALYRQVAQQRPDDPRLQFNLAVTCDAMGHYDEALDHYGAVLRSRPPLPAEIDRQRIVRRIGSLRQYLSASRSGEKG